MSILSSDPFLTFLTLYETAKMLRAVNRYRGVAVAREGRAKLRKVKSRCDCLQLQESRDERDDVKHDQNHCENCKDNG